MPNKPKRPCKHIGCPELTIDGYCTTHAKLEHDKKRDYDKARPKYHSWYSTTKWRAARQCYLFKNPICIECNKNGIITPATVVDHIKAHKGDVTLFWSKDNWRALCKRCHDIKTSREDSWNR